MDVKISGIDGVLLLLDRAPKGIVKNAFAKALTAAAVPVVRAVDSRTPEDTGDLKSHLMTDIAIDADGKGGATQVGFGSEGWKARLVETGHREVGHAPDKKDTGKVVAPHPFMAPAALAAADEAVEVFAESLTESLQGDVLKHAS